MELLVIIIILSLIFDYINGYRICRIMKAIDIIEYHSVSDIRLYQWLS